MAFKLKRYCLKKFDVRTGREVAITPPEPLRRYWTKSGTWAERERLNGSMLATGLPWRYEFRRR